MEIGSYNNDKETKTKYVCKVCYNMWGAPHCILDVGVDGFKPKRCPYDTGNLDAEWELIED